MKPVVRFSLPPNIRPPVLPTTGSSPASWYPRLGLDRHGIKDTLKPRQKILHLLRHAEGYHNLDPSVSTQAHGLDAKLTDKGRAQCAELGRHLQDEGFRPQLIVSSTMTRAIETGLLSLESSIKAHSIPFLMHEGVRETVNFLCDARRPISTISTEVESASDLISHTIDWSECAHEHDELWATYERKHGLQEEFTSFRESADLESLSIRSRDSFRWIGERPEQEIAVVSHSAFFWNTFNFGCPSPKIPINIPHPSNIPQLIDFGGDVELELWMRSGFSNCETRSILAEWL
eukprot:scaffold9637_cov47-Attheya_sp.AAC.1